jgi:hypothetical protein
MTRHPLDEYADRGSPRGAAAVYRAAAANTRELSYVTADPTRRSGRRVAAVVAAGAALVLLVGVLIVARNESDTAEVAEGHAVDLEEMRFTEESVLTRIGDRVVAVDGQFADGADPHLRAYLASADDPTHAEAFDFTDVGPVADITVGYVGAEALLVAQECPVPFDETAHPELDSGPRDAIEACGSKEFDVYSLDTTTGELHSLATDLTKPPDNIGLYLAASGPDRALLEWRPLRQLILIGRDGSMTDLPFPTADGPDPSAFCWMGGRFVTLVPDPSSDIGVSALELAGGSWRPLELPAVPGVPPDLTVVGCSDSGILLQASQQITRSSGLLLLTSNESRDLAWERLPVDGVAITEGQVIAAFVISGKPAISISDRFHDDETDPTPLIHEVYGWDGTQWRLAARQEGIAADAFTGDFEGTIALDRRGEYPDIYEVVELNRP